MQNMSFSEGSFGPGIAAELSEDYNHPIGAFAREAEGNAFYAYVNAATCPDCGSGMIRMGSCQSCPTCGLSACGM